MIFTDFWCPYTGKEKDPTVNVWELKGSNLISYIASYKVDDATGEALPGSSSLMKAANLCFASRMFKKGQEAKEEWGGTCCAEGSKVPAMPGL